MNNIVEFESPVKLQKLQDLNRIQKLQLIYCGFVDMLVETRKDQMTTQVSFCNYSYGFGSKSELFIYKLKWTEDNSSTFAEIEKQLEKIAKDY